MGYSVEIKVPTGKSPVGLHRFRRWGAYRGSRGYSGDPCAYVHAYSCVPPSSSSNIVAHYEKNCIPLTASVLLYSEGMRCVYVDSFEPNHLDGLRVGELSPKYPPMVTASNPDPRSWVRVRVRAAALNHHDIWSLKGVGLPDSALPMVLGTDGAGVTDDGDEVIIHSVITSPLWNGPETHDPSRTLLSEKYPGTMAEEVWVPRQNIIKKPATLSFAEAACLPTAYLTAFNLLYESAGLTLGQRVLIQGATGGVATAATALARAGGLHVTVSTRATENAEHAYAHGAHEVIQSGERLAQPVDAVIETVGEATWTHSLRSLRPGGVVAVAGATSGAQPPADLNRVFFLNLRIVGTTMGSRAQFEQLLGFLTHHDVRPTIHQTYDFTEDKAVHKAFAELSGGEVLGKNVLINEAN